MKQQGEGARATVRALGLAIALVLPGLTLAAVTAEIVGSLVAGATPPIDTAPFDLDRF